jgi:hypothetical protein
MITKLVLQTVSHERIIVGRKPLHLGVVEDVHLDGLQKYDELVMG